MATYTDGRPVSVLFVCLGNICRSPMAEGVFRNLARKSTLVSDIDSAGTGAYHSLEPPDERTMEVLHRHSIEYNHAARKVTKEDFINFDYLLAMDISNLRDLQRTRESVVASLKKKSNGADTKVAQVQLFGDFGPGGKLQQAGRGEVVQDPYYGGSNGFEEVYKQVTRFSQNFLDYLRNSST